MNMKTEFIKLYEELSTLNEGTLKEANSEASKKFWAAAKNKQIDEVSFHAAYDDELSELGITGIFNTDGTFINKGVYGKIKAAKEANPNSAAVKALLKLWVLRYSENILFSSEQAAKELQDKKSAEWKAEVERREAEQKEAILKEYRELLPDALSAVKPELLKEYLEAYNITEADIDLGVVKGLTKDGTKEGFGVLPTKLYVWTLNLNGDLRSKLINMLTKEFEGGMEKVKQELRQKKIRSNDVIDVIKQNQYTQDTICTAILIGDSGKVYYLAVHGGRWIKDLSRDLGTEITEVGYLSNIPEPYKVIYTSVTYSPRNYSTYRDSKSTSYYSWDSSEEAFLKPILPEIGKGEGVWSSWNTVSIPTSDGKYYSSMDNIDTWALTNHTSFATD